MGTFENAVGHGRGHEAVARLYELAREGDTGSGEYRQLDCLVYEGLQRRYGARACGDGSGQAPEQAPPRLRD